MAIQTTDFQFADQSNLYHGKVRDVYRIGQDLLVSIATDRISAFDVILPAPIPHKGQVLNQLAAHFLRATQNIVPNWLLSTPDPNVSVGKRCEPFAIEMVVRSLLVGHAWREYETGQRQLCGVDLPNGLKQYQAFAEPIITPSTKAHEGHDEDISAEDIIAQGLASKQEFAELSEIALKLFGKGQAMAAEQGLILADTKYEFGKLDGQIVLIDEIHTPDSSRYFYADSYQAYMDGETTEPPKHLSKEFVRQWLIDNNFMGQTGQTVPEMTDYFITMVSERYVELYECLTGQAFEPASQDDELARIEKAVSQELQKLASR